LNSFLEQKNQARLCLQTATDRLGMHAQQGDQLMRQLVEEVEQETFQNLKNSNLKEIVEQVNIILKSIFELLVDGVLIFQNMFFSFIISINTIWNKGTQYF